MRRTEATAGRLGAVLRRLEKDFIFYTDGDAQYDVSVNLENS